MWVSAPVHPINVIVPAVIRPENVITRLDLATGNKAKSLGVYMRAYKPAKAFKSSLKNYSDSRDVKTIPLYALGIALPPMLW